MTLVYAAKLRTKEYDGIILAITQERLYKIGKS